MQNGLADKVYRPTEKGLETPQIYAVNDVTTEQERVTLYGMVALRYTGYSAV